ncbi:aminotransferase class I/II-fold pyridoxal phosphate-dependent enzyme [Oceanobacillus halophilus]|uniref:Aminotransferase class I/II-fold pyridoxal phosphate-dependent enzyme n=2 Tax=Oceanobacillus halophilus TaxID=930130 RepID=A0A495A2I0_9BACI|nr:aminotransferase class I/II-fold pyridoxal phosphate-dependent enzyme [Oceanobacillus halophilus]RKQ33497.1 aminotransferase class I/II-fold pyridoxal phosphate-dependent enzyme [Oceanobacillus halophilus]
MKLSQSRIYLSPPHMSGNELSFVENAFRSNWIAPLGPNVDGFEKEIAEKVGAGAAAAVSSGTAAIHLALSLLGVNRGDKVFCSTLTFVASANPILYQGAEPVFIDSDLESWNMSPRALKKALHEAALNGKLPKAVIVVNLYGQSAKMDEILTICKEYEVPIIEDAAESLGSKYKGKASGTFGDFGVYSFNGNKIITTSGGGMLVSDDADAIEKSRYLATQARDPAPYYRHSVTGFNYRMSNILAGIGRAQLQVLDERVQLRRNIFDKYFKSLNDLSGIEFMKELSESQSNRWLTTLTVNEEQAGMNVNQLLDALYKENIEARPVWKPLHLQPLFKGATYYPHENGNSVSERLFKTGICLPSGSSLSGTEQQRIIQCIRDAYSNGVDLKLQEYEV